MKLKTLEELAKKYVSLCDTIHDGEAYKEMQKQITQDRQATLAAIREVIGGIDAQTAHAGDVLDQALEAITKLLSPEV